MLWNGNECGKNKRNENFKTTISSKNYERPKEPKNVKSFKYLGRILTNDGRCACEIKFRIAMAKGAFKKNRALFSGKMEKELRKKLVKCYIWSLVLWCLNWDASDSRPETPGKF
jgi:hypothetical protein